MDYCFDLIKRVGLSAFMRDLPLSMAFAQYLYERGEFQLAADLLVNLEGSYGNQTEITLALARVYRRVGDFGKAVLFYEKSRLSFTPEDWEGYTYCLKKQKRYDEALENYRLAHIAHPDHPGLLGKHILMAATLCDFDRVGNLMTNLQAETILKAGNIDPFTAAVTISDPALQKIAIESYAKRTFDSEPQRATKKKIQLDNLRWGFLGAEFRNHATSYLVVHLIEQLSESGIEIYLYDNGFDDHSAIRKRINIAAAKITNIRLLSDKAAAATIANDRLSCLFNLNGFFGGHRTGIFRNRPCSRQINFLGFPGTMGCSFIDEIIVDSVLVPLGQEIHYTERVTRLAGSSYQPGDPKRTVANSLSTRADHGLPPAKFVYGCFNNNYKITRETIAVWSKILNLNAKSVLWLLADNEFAKQNLLNEFSIRGVESKRIIFAERVNNTEHLERHRHMDLFLDTFPCNAHTTASDALSQGVPLVTKSGHTFAGRVSESLLMAFGLRELVAKSNEEYIQLALRIAKEFDAFCEKGSLQERQRALLRDRYKKHASGYSASFLQAIKNPRDL